MVLKLSMHSMPVQHQVTRPSQTAGYASQQSRDFHKCNNTDKGTRKCREEAREEVKSKTHTTKPPPRTRRRYTEPPSSTSGLTQASLLIAASRRRVFDPLVRHGKAQRRGDVSGCTFPAWRAPQPGHDQHEAALRRRCFRKSRSRLRLEGFGRDAWCCL